MAIPVKFSCATCGALVDNASGRTTFGANGSSTTRWYCAACFEKADAPPPQARLEPATRHGPKMCPLETCRAIADEYADLRERKKALVKWAEQLAGKHNGAPVNTTLGDFLTLSPAFRAEVAKRREVRDLLETAQRTGATLGQQMAKRAAPPSDGEPVDAIVKSSAPLAVTLWRALRRWLPRIDSIGRIAWLVACWWGFFCFMFFDGGPHVWASMLAMPAWGLGVNFLRFESPTMLAGTSVLATSASVLALALR